MDALRKPALCLLLGIIGATSQNLCLAQVDDVEAAPEPVRRYTVELIVFTYDNSVSPGTEVFVPDKPLVSNEWGSTDRRGELDSADKFDPDLAGDVRAFGDTIGRPEKLSPDDEVLGELLETQSLNLKLLREDELTLTNEHERLRRLDAYEPVLWAGWTQDVHEEDKTAPIRLRRLGNLPLSMDGEMKLYLGRFLHLVADINMQAPGTGAAKTSYRARPARALGRDYDYAPDRQVDATAVYYRIDDDRIMKNGSRRYFDHPKFGILAVTTRAADAGALLDEDADSAIDATAESTIGNL